MDKRRLHPFEVSDASEVLHLKLWEGTTFDYSLNGNICVATNTVIGNGGFEFNATSSKIDGGSDSVIDNIFAGGGTISWWQRIDGKGESDFGVVLDKTVWGCYMNNSLTDMVFYQNFSGDDYSSGFAVSSGVWQNITIVYNNALTTEEITVYVNGGSIASSAGSPTGTADSDASNNLYIGNSVAEDSTWDGGLSDIRFYNVERTAAQIRDFYEQTRWRYGI